MSNLCEHVLTSPDFESVFNEPISVCIQDRIKKYDLRYFDITSEERDICLQKIVSTLLSDDLVYSGEHRKEQWGKGWGQNLDDLLKNSENNAIKPRYFGKYEINRFKQKFIRAASENFEYNMLGVILDWLFDKYLKEYETVYEFGCGTGHNLARLRSFNPNADLWGLDWAESSQGIIDKYAVINADNKLHARKFDLFNPDFNFELKKGSALYTVASLEQTGERYHSFVDYILKNKPKICFHVEPIEETLDQDNLMDFLSIAYFRKRKYLSGYLTYLNKLELKGKIEIIRTQRTYIGSFFIEGYSIIIWRPI